MRPTSSRLKTTGSFFSPGGPHELEQLPLAAQRALVEELDAAEGDGETGRGEVLDVGEVEEVLAELVLPELVGGPVEVCGQLADGADVGLLGPRGEPPELQVFEHVLAEWRHDVPFLGGWRRQEEGCDVTSLAARAGEGIENTTSAIRRRRIEFNFSFQRPAPRVARRRR
jgi:hypothetical protein